LELINEKNIKKYLEEMHSTTYGRPDEVAFFDLIQFIIFMEKNSFWLDNREHFKEYIGI